MGKLNKLKAAAKTRGAPAPSTSMDPVLEISGARRGPVALETLRLDGDTQPRVSFDRDTISSYQERMSDRGDGVIVDPEGHEWAAITVFDDGQTQWLADGFHRVHAARALGLTRFQAEIMAGEVRDAVRYSLSVNERHGLKRAQADRRNAVTRALRDPVWGKHSSRDIARLCAVSDFLVRTVRRELEGVGEIEASAERVGQDGKVHDVTAHVRRRPTSTRAQLRGAKLCEPSGLVPKLRAEHTIFDALDSSALEPVSLLVVHAQGSVEILQVIDHLERLLTPGGCLILTLVGEHFPAHAVAALTERVGALGWPEPKLVALRRERTHALVVDPNAGQLSGWMESSVDLLDAVQFDRARVLMRPDA